MIQPHTQQIIGSTQQASHRIGVIPVADRPRGAYIRENPIGKGRISTDKAPTTRSSSQAKIPRQSQASFTCAQAGVCKKWLFSWCLTKASLCFSIKDLAINGWDLQQAGFTPGPEIGKCLSWLLGQVQDEVLPNEQQVLLHTAKELLEETE